MNDNELTQKIFQYAKIYFSEDSRISVMKAPPMLGGEDFSAFSNKVPGCYIGVGALNKQCETIYPHHHPKFNFDEEALKIALHYYVSVGLYLTGQTCI